MSSTQMYTVPVKGEIKAYERFKNSHLGSPFIWNFIWTKYLAETSELEGFHYAMVDSKNLEPLWALYTSDKLEPWERIVLGSTYDRVIVKKENLELLCNAYKKFHHEAKNGKHAINHGSHLIEQACAIEKLIESQDDELLGICWNQTTVVGDMWYCYDVCCECGQDLEEGRMFDITKDDDYEAWFLFDHIPDTLSWKPDGQ